MFGGFPQGVPGNDAFTKILLHMDGSNGGTTFTDVNAGGSAHTWTPTNATTSTAASKFGGASMLASAGRIITPDSADFALASQDWEADFWFNPNGGTGVIALCGQLDASSTAAGSSFYLLRDASNRVQLGASTGSGITTVTSTSTLTGSSPIHVTGMRRGNILNIFMGGAKEGGDVAFSATIPNSAASFGIGRLGSYTGVADASGYFDEFRLSVGTSRWTSNFTPPAGPYT